LNAPRTPALMKLRGLVLLFSIPFVFSGCGHANKIIYGDYKYEKKLFGTNIVEFDIYLENIGNFEKASGLISGLIYQGKDFEEYAAYREKEFVGFIEDTGGEHYPPKTGEDGTEDFYRSNVKLSYTVEYSGGSYVIVKHDLYYYYCGAAHGNYRTEYFIIDLSEKRILGVNDLINPVPDGLLKGVLEAGGNAVYYLRDNIWPPDTVNFSKDNIELIWNPYQITPYSYGIIKINNKDINIEQYLTEKGKKLKRSM